VHYTQVELTSPDGKSSEVVWLPVPEGRAEVGERITRKIPEDIRRSMQREDEAKGRITITPHVWDWTVTQVCVTLLEEDLPANAKKATNFHREAQTTAYMLI